MRMLLWLSVLAAVNASSWATGWAQTAWPEFRGPRGDGHAVDASLPVAIDESVVQWETPIHGKGWSSPVVWGSEIWLTTASEDGTEMSVVCVDRTSGRVLHDKVIATNDDPAFCHPTNSYASPTPAIEEGRLYVHFGAEMTACIDTATAEVLWRRDDFHCDHYRGPASSPILHDGKLLIAFDGFDIQYVVALDTRTGKTVWQRDREIDYGTDNGDRMKSYSTGSILTIDGRDVFVSPSASATIAYDPTTGQTLWMVYHDGMNASARPVLAGGRIFIANGSGAMVAVRISQDGKPSDEALRGDVTATHLDWTSGKAVSKKASPLYVDGLVYMNSDDGVLSCREAESGEVLWLKRAGGEYAASPIYADGRIYFFSSHGDVVTVAPGREYHLLAETKLGDGFMASPAVVSSPESGDALILRSKSVLYSIAKTDAKSNLKP